MATLTQTCNLVLVLATMFGQLFVATNFNDSSLSSKRQINATRKETAICHASATRCVCVSMVTKVILLLLLLLLLTILKALASEGKQKGGVRCLDPKSTSENRRQLSKKSSSWRWDYFLLRFHHLLSSPAKLVHVSGKLVFLFLPAEKVEIYSESVNYEEITLRGLAKFQNYSIQIVAATRVGEGLKSRSIYCRTQQDGRRPDMRLMTTQAFVHILFALFFSSRTSCQCQGPEFGSTHGLGLVASTPSAQWSSHPLLSIHEDTRRGPTDSSEV